MSDGAFAVHGLSDSFLADTPLFAAIADDLVAFLADSRLVIHNASFDVGFLDMEFSRIGKPRLAIERVVDTLTMARRKHPGTSNSLDALCSRYGIDASKRVKHGALLDAEILSDVYIELLGGKQADFGLSSPARRDRGPAGSATGLQAGVPLKRDKPLEPRLSQGDMEAHEAFVATLAPQPIWLDYQKG